MVLYSRSQCNCYNFLFKLCMWNRFAIMTANTTEYNTILEWEHSFTDNHYTLTKRLSELCRVHCTFEILSYVWSNLFFRKYLWTGECTSSYSTWKFLAYLWSHLIWNIICYKKVSCFAKIMFYKTLLHFFTFYIVQLRVSDHSVFQASSKISLWAFSKLAHENGLITIVPWTCRALCLN